MCDPALLQVTFVPDLGRDTIVNGRSMKTRYYRMLRWGCLLGACVFQGCAIDPDIRLRAGISFGSDLAIFLLQNLAASV